MKRFGPGFLVTAAFIGPGSIATASAAGANFGFVLLWALVFSIVATIVLQEMAARLGLVSGEGLSQALRTTFQNPIISRCAVILVVAAIGLGNAAYEAGNISGAAMGLQSLTDMPLWICAIFIGSVGAVLLGTGAYRSLEALLILLVLIMSGVFLFTMLMIDVNVSALLSGVFTPSMPKLGLP